MIRWISAMLAVMLAGCGDPALAPAIAATCEASEEAFVLQVLPWLQARRPAGIRELRLLAGLIRDIDGRGGDGREIVADSLARGPRFERRWSIFLSDHLLVDRAGHRARPGCHAARALPGDHGELAAWIRDHGPDDPPPGRPAWTFADLLASSVALDDLSPLLRGHLLVRASQPIDGNNVAAGELEAARRHEFAASFAAGHLGRTLECLACHNSEGSVTDREDPATDRFWPIDLPLERAAFGASTGRDPAEVEAVFRVAGVVDGPLLPWGSDACSSFVDGRDGDLLGISAYLGGPLPVGANLLDLEPRLRAGWAALREAGWDGLDAEALAPDVALATMSAMHLADAVWRELGGQPLTLAHGFPRTVEQREVLAELTHVFIDEGFSLRALVVAAATHPQLAIDLPARCDALGVTSPAVLAPFAVHAIDPAARGDSLGDLVHRHGAFTLLAMVAETMGWPPPTSEAGPYGLAEEELWLDLGARISSAQPGHEGLDLVALLAFEAAVGAGVDPGWTGDADPVWAEGDVIDALIDLARADPGARVEDVVVAIKDRTHTDPEIHADERAEIEAVLAVPLTQKVVETDEAALEAGLRALAGALLRAPQFILAGAVQLPDRRVPAPRLVLPGTDMQTLCAALAAGFADESWQAVCGPDARACIDTGGLPCAGK